MWAKATEDEVLIEIARAANERDKKREELDALRHQADTINKIGQQKTAEYDNLNARVNYLRSVLAAKQGRPAPAPEESP